MAGRTHAQIDVDIWARMRDHDLSRDARLLYPCLLAQRKLTMAGHLDIRLKAWSADTAMTVAEVTAALEELEDIGWVTIDWDTDELIITGYVRRLQVRNSKNVKGMWRHWDRIDSQLLREAVVANLPDGCPTYDQALKPGTTPTPSPPNRPTRRPTDRPIEQASDPTGDLRPDTGDLTPTSSSAGSSHSATHIPVDDDEDHQLANTHLDAHLRHRSGEIHSPARFRQALLPQLLAAIAEARAAGRDPATELETRWETRPPDPACSADFELAGDPRPLLEQARASPDRFQVTTDPDGRTVAHIRNAS